MYQYMSRSDNDRRFMPELLIKLAMGTIADTVIIPAQDYLDISDGRINAPGTTGSNWTFRLEANAFSQHEKEVMAFIVGTFGRYQQAKPKPEPEPTEEEASGEEETTSTDPSEAVEKPSVSALE
jgi:4-alpha-glucanotransferase